MVSGQKNKIVIMVSSSQEFHGEDGCPEIRRKGECFRDGCVLQIIRLLTPYKVSDSISFRLHGPYSQLPYRSTPDVSTEVDFHGVIGWLAQGLENDSHIFLCLWNSSGPPARRACLGDQL